jgi:hypothetical protein
MNAYRRHNPAKCRFRSRTEYRCKCPIWVEGVKDGRRIREALKLRDWNRAQELVREWDVEGKKPKRKYRATIEEWRDQFLQDAAARHLTEATLRLYKLLFKQLIEFALEHGITCADELDGADRIPCWLKDRSLDCIKEVGAAAQLIQVRDAPKDGGGEPRSESSGPEGKAKPEASLSER